MIERHFLGGRGGLGSLVEKLFEQYSRGGEGVVDLVENGRNCSSNILGGGEPNT